VTAPAVAVPASAQVSLGDFQSIKPTFFVPAATDASSDNSASVIYNIREIKSNIIQIKDIHFSNMINKVQNTNILLKFQSSHTISISTSIKDILASSCKRPIENAILFVDDKTNLYSINQQIMPYGKGDSASLSKQKHHNSSCKGMAEWIY
jgi:hypothetical protein